MISDKHDAFKATLTLLMVKWKDRGLSPARGHEMSVRVLYAAGALARTWLPMGTGRRIIMVAIAAMGLWGLFQENHALMWIWAALPLFSPRCMGELALFMGRSIGGLANFFGSSNRK